MKPYTSPAYERAKAEREAAQRERERQAAAAQREAEWLNTQARQQREAKLQAERDAQRATDEARLDAEIDKAGEQAHWLAEHPGLTAADFERHAWPQLRPLLLQRHQHAKVEQLTGRLRATGLYRL
jgi:hypothetical protein